MRPSDILTTQLLDRALEDSAAAYQRQMFQPRDDDAYTRKLQTVPEIPVEPTHDQRQQQTPATKSSTLSVRRSTRLSSQPSAIVGISGGASGQSSSLGILPLGPRTTSSDDEDDGMELDD